jgi:hypothetical protein
MIKKTSALLAALAVLAVMPIAGCTRIETGEVGMRVNFDKTIDPTELQPGTWNQTVFGDVITFPVKDLTVALENKTPLTSDNTPLSDLDATVVYNINPSKVAEIYTTKSRSFHTVKDGDIYLMHSYMETLVNNAAYKAVRQHAALTVGDNREKIEEQIKLMVLEQLQTENLGQALNLSVVKVRNILPNAQIMQAATEYVRAQNELKIKTTQVEIARKEAERMAALATNSERSVAYMDAQARLNISEGVKAGKVHTIVVPADFKGFVNVGK